MSSNNYESEAYDICKSYLKPDVDVIVANPDNIYELEIKQNIEFLYKKYTFLPLVQNNIIINSRDLDKAIPIITFSTTSYYMNEKDRYLLLLSKLIQFQLYHHFHNHPGLLEMESILSKKIKMTKDKWKDIDEYYLNLVITFNEFKLLYKNVKKEEFEFIRNGFWRHYKLLDKQLYHTWYTLKKIFIKLDLLYKKII